MKIHVSRVPEGGMQETASYDPAGLDMDREDVRVSGTFKFDADISLVSKQLVVQGTVRASLDCQCARCLEVFDKPFKSSVIFSYEVSPADIVDTTDEVRQEIMLGYPMVPLCREDCKGLCPCCGQNLNEGACLKQGSSKGSGLASGL